MPKLENRLVHTCVVVGINKEVELVPFNNTVVPNSTDKYGPYKQYLLGVFNESIAYFPESLTKVEGEPFYAESNVICPAAIPDSFENSQAISTSDARPFPMDIVQNLPTFCFPSGGYVHTQDQILEPEITYLVLTDLDGLRTYAACMTCIRPYVVIKTIVDEVVTLRNPNPDLSECLEDGTLLAVYAPICVCLLSAFPFFNTMKDCLSSLVPQIQQDTNASGKLEDFWRIVMKLGTTLTLIPVPPAGPLAVSFFLSGSQHTIYPAAEAGRRVVDIDIHLPLLIFSPENIIIIITCLLTEQRMVFMASSYPLLTTIIESFFTYIDPIKYVHTYVPTLPNILGDYLEAPGQFIMGVHSSLKLQVRQIRKQPEIPNIVLVDIDKGIVDLGKESYLPDMPDIVAQSLTVRLKKVSPHFDLKLVSMPTMFTYKDVLQQRRNLVEHVRLEIRVMCLDMLVTLFGSIFNFMSFGLNYFNFEAFLQSRNDDERAFYKEVILTDAFKRFIDDRLEKQEMRDEFAVLGERVAQRERSRGRAHTAIIQQFKQNAERDIIPKHDIFTIPMILEESLSSGNYYNSYCSILSNQLNLIGQKSMRLRASYTYLRGFAHIACEKPIEGLRDFYALDFSAPELFPKEFAAEVVNNLDPSELKQLQSESFYKQTLTWRTFTNIIDDQMNNTLRKLTNEPVDKSEFENKMKPLKVVISTELMDWLFQTLATHEEESIPHQTYNEFCKVYSQIEKRYEIDEVAGVKIGSKILKVSSLISSGYGMGRLVLTIHKLYFIRGGAQEEMLIMSLCDIKEIIQYQHKSVFGTGVNALRFINSDKYVPPFYACLKEECETWLLFVKEMTAGHYSSIILREENMVKISFNNVMVAQALLEMNFQLKDVEGACYFMKKRATENKGLSDDTKDALHIRLDPCLKEKSLTTVWSIVYVPGNPERLEPACIWCGMGSGAIVIYETEKWNWVTELRYGKKRISRLLFTGSNQIYAGSIDTVIYVINTESRKLEQKLQKHTDFVSDIISQVKVG